MPDPHELRVDERRFADGSIEITVVRVPDEEPVAGVRVEPLPQRPAAAGAESLDEYELLITVRDESRFDRPKPGRGHYISGRETARLHRSQVLEQAMRRMETGG